MRQRFQRRGSVHSEEALGFRPFSAAQLHAIIEGSSRNHAIYGCHAAQTPMKSLIEDADGKVSRRTIQKYRQAVKSWPY